MATFSLWTNFGRHGAPQPKAEVAVIRYYKAGNGDPVKALFENEDSKFPKEIAILERLTTGGYGHVLYDTESNDEAIVRKIEAVFEDCRTEISREQHAQLCTSFRERHKRHDAAIGAPVAA